MICKARVAYRRQRRLIRGILVFVFCVDVWPDLDYHFGVRWPCWTCPPLLAGLVGFRRLGICFRLHYFAWLYYKNRIELNHSRVFHHLVILKHEYLHSYVYNFLVTSGYFIQASRVKHTVLSSCSSKFSVIGCYPIHGLENCNVEEPNPDFEFVLKIFLFYP